MSTTTVTATDFEIDQSVDDETFRLQVRDWIGRHTTEGLAEMADWSRLLAGQWWSYPVEMKTKAYKDWDEAMVQEHLVCGHWPSRYGGRDLTTAQSGIVDQECLRANVPRVFRDQGEAWAGPSILDHGSEEQKDYYIPRIIKGEITFCQGFSEPNQGSDLAAIDTRGVIEGDYITITGQKIWTTFGKYANHIFLLCRTDPDKSLRHRGISFVIANIADAGKALEFRGIRQLTGDDEFCETFIDGLRLPVDSIIGGVNNGWAVAMTTLSNERAGRAAAARNSVFAKNFRDLMRVADENGRMDDPEVRRQAVEVYSSLEALHYWASGQGKEIHASVEKLVSSHWGQQFGRLAMLVLGDQAALRPEGVGTAAEGGEYRLNKWQMAYFHSLASTIASGSSEIQRNVISERLLGMPREARG